MAGFQYHMHKGRVLLRRAYQKNQSKPINYVTHGITLPERVYARLRGRKPLLMELHRSLRLR